MIVTDIVAVQNWIRLQLYCWLAKHIQRQCWLAE